jgi:hypothetical protein
MGRVNEVYKSELKDVALGMTEVQNTQPMIPFSRDVMTPRPLKKCDRG